MAKELFEIKSGNEGYGFLIEKDGGYIDFGDERNSLNRQQLNKIGSGEHGIEIVDRLKVVAIMQKCDRENANGRIYPRSVLEKEVKKYQERIDDRRSYGESNHPESITLDLDRLSFGVTRLWWEGKTLFGELELILSLGFIKYGIISCKGDMIANYLRLGWKIGISSRGLGSVEQDKYTGKYIVQDDFEITCWDFVTDGSTPGSWVLSNVMDLKPYVESKETNKSKVVEGLEKFLGNKKVL